MTIELFINNSDTNVVSKVLTSYGEVPGTMRHGTSILDPDFDLAVDPNQSPGRELKFRVS